MGDWNIRVFVMKTGNYIYALVWYPDVLIIVFTEMYVIKIILTKITTSECWILVHFDMKTVDSENNYVHAIV